MAIQEIRYGGMTAQPSDYENKDGELAVAVNLLNEEGHLSPLLPATVVKELPSSTAAVYIHDTAKFKHYIVISTTGAISWIDETDMETTHSTGLTISGIKKVVPLGNTLCILHEGGMDYLLWNAETEAYKKLDPQLPEIKLSFGLQCEWKDTTSHASRKRPPGNYAGDSEVIINRYYVGSQEFLDDLNNCVNSAINKIMQSCREEGKFAMPFFVRYAYKLYDGSYTLQSAPILMIPNTGHPLVSHYGGLITDDVDTDIDDFYYCMMPACELDVQATVPESLSDYSDVITSVDIFVSSPLYTYDPNKKIFSFEKEEMYNYTGWGVYKVNPTSGIFPHEKIYREGQLPPWVVPPTGGNPWGLYTGYAKRNTILSMLTFASAPHFFRYFIKLPAKSLSAQIRDCCNFYKIHSIKTTKLGDFTSRAKLELEDNVLTTLENNMVLTDDYDSHVEKKPDAIYSYNQRLLQGGGVASLYNGYFNITHIEQRIQITGNLFPQNRITEVQSYEAEGTQFPTAEKYELQINDFSTSTVDDLFRATEVYVNIRRAGKEYQVKEDLGDGIKLLGGFQYFIDSTTPERRSGDYSVPWFYYPDPDAYEARIRTYRSDLEEWFHYKVTLEPHDTLNGAYYFDNFAWNPLNTGTSGFNPSTDKTYKIENKLYTSEVLNPWYFPVEGIVTVGNGELTALSAATQALSQGQFGEFPLYAFCTDGVWALTVGATGYFTRSVPVSRDVCTNPDSVLQIDDAVIYPTDRGLMLLAGSKNVCFTEPMNNREGKDYESQLPGMRELRAMAGLSAPSTNATVATRQHRCLNPAPLREFLQDCKMIYDYVGQKIVVYNPKIETYEDGQVSRMYRKYKYALVYSLKTNLWGMTETDLQWTVNSYPEAMGMTDEKKLVSLTPSPSPSGEGSTVVTGLFVTRPLKLGAPDVLKTVRTVMQRGMFRRGDVKSVLWGSRDLYNWYLIHSSQDEGMHNMSGTPYKYFIIGGLVTLTEGKSVSGASLEVEAKMTDVLR